MNISNDNLSKLKCSECDCFLSRIPIYLKEDGSAICGRCPIPEAENSEEPIRVFRMKPYENIVANIVFPCMHQNNGCPEQISCLDLQNHEESCNFRPYVCPLQVGICNWIGCHKNVYEHCQSEHSDSILEHPCVLKHNITGNSTKSYVTKLFNVFFLIHAKVCLNTHKIFHSVHCLDNTNITNMFFELIIRREHEQIVKRGKIEPLGCRIIKENLSISCGINSLIDILNGFDETTFTIKITCINYCKICTLVSNIFGEGNCCQTCDKRLRNCQHFAEGCRYKDIDIKTFIHERSLCKFTNWCWICNRRKVNSPSFTKHYEIDHKNVSFKNNVYWNIEENMFNSFTKELDFLIISKYDTFYCTLYNFEKNFLIEMCASSLNTEQLTKFKCVVSIKNNTNVKEVDLVFYVNHKIDFYNTIPRDYLFANRSSYQMKVRILKQD